MLGKRILLVDDNDLVRESVAELLRDADADVLCASNADEALPLVDEKLSALVVDFRLGDGLTGQDLAVLVRQVCPGIRVVVITGDPAGWEADAGAAETLLRKPFGMMDLLRAIDGV